MRTSDCVILAMILGVTPGPSQTILHDIPGPTIQFAAILNGFGDVDGDGFGDFGVLEGVFIPGQGSSTGKVHVYSGASGALIRTFNPPPGEATFGGAFGPVGDLDGDGVVDIFIASFSTTRFYSVVSGTLLMSFPGPRSFISIGDVDGDTVPDLATTRAGLQVYSGANLSPIYSVPDPAPGQFFGWSLDRIPDLNGDGVDEIIVGNPGAIGAPCCPGRVWIFSGIDGTDLRTHTGIAVWDYFGWDVSDLDDVDGDGTADYDVWSPGYPGLFQGLNSLGGVGRTFVYSGATGAVLFTIDCPAGCPTPLYSDGQVENIGDIDGDGAADVLQTLVSGAGPPGQVVVYSGATGAVLAGIEATPPTTSSFTLAAPASPIGDIDGDGARDVVVRGCDYTTGVCHAVVVSLAPENTSVFGSGCPSSGPRIGRSGSLGAGSTFTVNVSGVAPNRPACLVVGISDTVWAGGALPLDLGGAGLPGCFLLVSPDVLLDTITVPIGPVSAGASFSFQMPPMPQGSLYAQWAVLAPPGSPLPLQLSPALRADF
jgi:hypothetical protein